MASTKDYLDFVLDLLREVSGVSYKKMMGEYILYKDNVIFGGVYDNRFLVKPTVSLKEYELKEQTPYPGGKNMLLVESENADEIKDIVLKVYNDLSKKKPIK